MSAYSYVEYVTGDFILQCRRFPEYNEVTKNFPWDPAKRPGKLRNIAAIQGPMAKYAGRLSSIAEDLEKNADTRHLMGHAHTTAISRNRQVQYFELRMYDRGKGLSDVERLLVLKWTIEQIQEAKAKISAMSGNAHAVFREIYKDFGFAGAFE